MRLCGPMRRLRFLSGLVLMMVVLALAGCGQTSPPASPAPSQAPAAPPAAAQKAATSAPAQPSPPAKAPPPMRKLVATVPTLSSGQWDYYVADAKGFFKARGLELERVIAESNTKAVQALISGSSHIANGSPDAALRAISGGADLVIIGANTSRPLYSMIGAKGIDTWADLKGKRIGVSATASMDAIFVRQLMAKHGLKEGDYQMVEVGGTSARMAAIQSGAISAGLLNQPSDFQAIRLGFKRIGLSTEIPSDVTWSAFTVRKDWARQNEETMVRFMAAIRTTHLFMWDAKNRRETAAILAKETNTSQEDAEQTYDLMIQGNAISKEGEVTLEGLTNMANALREQKLLTGDLDVKTTFDLSYLDKARKQ